QRERVRPERAQRSPDAHRPMRLRQVRHGEARQVAGREGKEIGAVLDGGHAGFLLQWPFRNLARAAPHVTVSGTCRVRTGYASRPTRPAAAGEAPTLWVCPGKATEASVSYRHVDFRATRNRLGLRVRGGIMNRRDFVAGTVGASLVPVLGQAAANGQTPEPTVPAGKPQVLELRRVHVKQGQMVTRYHEYAKNALVPALNRAGVKPVGAFSVAVGPDSPTVYLLLPHSSADAMLTLTSRLNDDAEYQKAAAAFRALPASDPPYLRRE